MILTNTTCFFCFFWDGLKLKHLKPSRNDHHCSLTVPAVRHVWPLLEGSQQWRYDILSLLFEWSQRSISAKAMAEFAARYPQHLQMLIDIVAKEKKEDALPPGKGGTGKNGVVGASCCIYVLEWERRSLGIVVSKFCFALLEVCLFTRSCCVSSNLPWP